MTDPKPVKHIRALDRGLAVLEHLSNHGSSGLADLRPATGLTNATLLRLLATLQNRGWVRRNIVEGQYELSHTLGDLLGANVRAHPLAEIAAPIMMEMDTRSRGFPSDLCAVIAAGKLELVESTRIRGPLAPARTGKGVQPSFLRSAHGRALLAALDPAEFEVHMREVARTEAKENRRLLETGKLADELDLTRKRGFGLRDDDYFVHAAFDPGPELAAMAVPIHSASGIHGTLSLLWMRAATTLEDALSQGVLETLSAAAGQIGAAMDERGLAAPRFAAEP